MWIRKKELMRIYERIQRLEEASFMHVYENKIYSGPFANNKPVNEIVKLISDFLDVKYKGSECAEPRLVKNETHNPRNS